MATLFLKTAGGVYSAAATWSNVNAAGVDNSGPPTAADDVILELASGNLTISAAAACRSFDCQGGTGSYTGTVTHNSSITLSIGDGTAGIGSRALRLASGMTYTLGSAVTSAISFVSSSATSQTINTAGKTLGNVTVNQANIKLQLAANLTSSGSWTMTSANTWDSNTFTITLNGAAATFTGGSKTYNGLVSMTGSGTATVTASTFSAGFTRTGTAATADTLSLSGDIDCTGATFTCNGNSVTNRMLVLSNTLGTARTITAGTVTVTNADFKDITGAGAGSWNLASITGKSGDCGGNSGITFTTAATQTATGTASFVWSTHGWTSRVPLPQDDVVINNAFVAGRTVTLDMPRAGKSINWSGTTGTPLWSISINSSIFGSLTMISGMSIFANVLTVTMEGRGSFTFTSAGLTWKYPLVLSMIGGTLTLQDAFNSTKALTRTDSTSFNANNFNVTATTITSTATGALTMGSGTWTVGSTGTVWSAGSSETVTAGTSTIKINDTSSTAKTFAGNGKTYNDLSITTGGSGTVTITGANTFGHILVTGGSTKSIVLPGSTTTTLTGTQPFPSGVAGNLITFTASSGSATVSCANAIDVDYISLTNIPGAGAGIPFYPGTHSTDGGGNTNWNFASGNMLLMF